jgi:hypothetical protein
MYNTNFDGSEKIRIRKKKENNGNERGRKGRIIFSNNSFDGWFVSKVCLLAELTRSSRQGLTC